MMRGLAYHLRHCVTHRLTVIDSNGTEDLAEERFDEGDSECRRERDSRWGIFNLSSAADVLLGCS